MLSVTSMKALLSPPLSPYLFKTRPFPLRFSINSKPLQNPNRRYHLRPINSSFNSPISPNSIESLSLHADTAHPRSGEIHVIVGPMFAGKTTTLLRQMKSESSNGRSIAIIKSNKDTRYGLDSIVTHDGEKLPCWPLADLSSFKQKCGADAYKNLDVIGIDEAQFFDDLYDFCRKAAGMDGKTVIVAGLDGDYLRRKFGSILDIVHLADSVTKLNARCELCCELCGKRAFFTLRTDERQRELIGGADMYMPVCRTHYVDGQVIKDATRIVYEYQKIQSAA